MFPALIVPLRILTVLDRSKTFVFMQDPYPLLDLVGHLFAMAIHDDIFAPEFREIEDIYWAKIPSHKVGMQVKIKREKLDLPVFRQPERSENGYRTSDSTPLKASTWSNYLRPLGRLAGLKYLLTQYVFRRTTINYINSMNHLSLTLLPTLRCTG